MPKRALLALPAGLVLCLVILPSLLVRGCRPAPAGPRSISVALYQSRAKRLVRLDLEEYLGGVVAAEMPARFSPEALKAQAVAARTLALKRMRSLGGRGCRDCTAADLCDQPDCGQAWLADADLRRIWGWHYRSYREKIARAVAATRGLVLLYDHEPIDAVYHSTCGGRTENAAALWGRVFPYLVSVPCSFDSFSPRYRIVVRLSSAQLAARLGLKAAAGKRHSRETLDLRVIERTSTGRVARLRAGGITFEGAQFRRALDLRSADFNWEWRGDEAVFTVRGYGHGVGLCQYGAEGMARKGADYWQILRHYYQGVSLGRIKR